MMGPCSGGTAPLFLLHPRQNPPAACLFLPTSKGRASRGLRCKRPLEACSPVLSSSTPAATLGTGHGCFPSSLVPRPLPPVFLLLVPPGLGGVQCFTYVWRPHGREEEREEGKFGSDAAQRACAPEGWLYCWPGMAPLGRPAGGRRAARLGAAERASPDPALGSGLRAPWKPTTKRLWSVCVCLMRPALQGK